MPDSIFGQGKWLTPAEVQAWERLHGTKPIGYRATGPVQWFTVGWPESAPCCKCGTNTDRFFIGYAVIEKRDWGGATYCGHVLCAETAYAFCWDCERVAVIDTLRKRQPLNLSSEVAYLAELEAEQHAA